jgi:hypothetical protein
MMRHQLARAAVLVVAAGMAACEMPGTEPADQLTLTVETPEALDWGGSGILRVTLTNAGDRLAEGGIIEVYVPTWLEFGRVEPAGTAVTVLSGDVETRFSYALTDTLAPGERHTIVQHLRVASTPLPAVPATDTAPPMRAYPTNQVVRARLLTAAGTPVGAEVQAALQFAGAPRPAPPVPAPLDTVPPVDTMPPLPRRDTVPDTVTVRPL